VEAALVPVEAADSGLSMGERRKTPMASRLEERASTPPMMSCDVESTDSFEGPVGTVLPHPGPKARATKRTREVDPIWIGRVCLMESPSLYKRSRIPKAARHARPRRGSGLRLRPRARQGPIEKEAKS